MSLKELIMIMLNINIRLGFVIICRKPFTYKRGSLDFKVPRTHMMKFELTMKWTALQHNDIMHFKDDGRTSIR